MNYYGDRQLLRRSIFSTAGSFGDSKFTIRSVFSTGGSFGYAWDRMTSRLAALFFSCAACGPNQAEIPGSSAHQQLKPLRPFHWPPTPRGEPRKRPSSTELSISGSLSLGTVVL